MLLLLVADCSELDGPDVWRREGPEEGGPLRVVPCLSFASRALVAQPDAVPVLPLPFSRR